MTALKYAETMEKLLRFLLLNAVRPLGYEGLEAERVCGEITGTSTDVWYRQPDECERIIEMRVRGYSVIICTILSLHVCMQAMRVFCHIVASRLFRTTALPRTFAAFEQPKLHYCTHQASSHRNK